MKWMTTITFSIMFRSPAKSVVVVTSRKYVSQTDQVSQRIRNGGFDAKVAVPTLRTLRAPRSTFLQFVTKRHARVQPEAEDYLLPLGQEYESFSRNPSSRAGWLTGHVGTIARPRKPLHRSHLSQLPFTGEEPVTYARLGRDQCARPLSSVPRLQVEDVSV